MIHRQTNSILLTAVSMTTAALVAGQAAAQVVVDGTVNPGEYGPALVSQNTPTGFGDNLSELNQAFANYTPGGNLELALTGNLEGNGNGVVIFIDSKAGGGIADSVPGGFGRFGSMGGARVDDWGTDTDGTAAVSPTPGGGSIISPNFNPDYALEISHNGTSYFINVIDLTVPNEPNDNRDVFLGSNTLGTGGVTQTYLRDAGFTDAGDVTHAFNNSNAAGVNGFNFDNPPGDLGDPSSATTGFEFLFENQFLAHTPGQAVRILPFVTNGGGDYLSNQFLPGVNGDGNLEQAGNGPGGTPLFDSRFYGDQFYIPLFVPTSDGTGGTWAGATWSGGVAPNGAEHAARLVNSVATNISLGGGAIALGYLELSNPNGFTISGGPLALNGGDGAAALFVTAGSHSITSLVNIPTATRVNVAQDAALMLGGGVSLAAGKSLTKVGTGALTISGAINGAGTSLAVDAGTVTLNGDFGSGIVTPADRPDLFASAPGGSSGALVVFNASQHLDNMTANPDGTIRLSAGADKTVVVNNVAASGTGKIDLVDNKLIVKTAAATGTWDGTAYTGVAGLVDAGRGSVGNAMWDGSGIVTTDTRAINSGDLVSIGVAAVSEVRPIDDTETTTFAGQTVLGSDTVAMVTWGGDANLDGIINIDDYGRIDGNVAQSGSVFGWSRGDFNYDGKINIDDYGIIDGNINRQGAPFSVSDGAVSGVAAVPEPAGLALAGLTGVGLLRRRRRD